MTEDICVIPDCTKPRDKKQNRRICSLHRTRYSRYKSYDLPLKGILPAGIVKICKKHGPLKKKQTKKRVKGKDWLTCLKCLAECEKRFTDKVGHQYRNEYRKSYNIGGKAARRAKLILSKKDYQSLLEKQNYVCAICNKPETARKKGSDEPMRLAIDHCHETKKIRGLLCLNCNSCLQRSLSFKESLPAIQYLKKHQ